MNPRYSIVIPVYNSGRWLADLVAQVERAMDTLGESYELVLVNDCSPDGTTWLEIERLAAQDPRVRGIDLLFNVGQFRATFCGLEQARGDFILTMDDDFQHPPEELPNLARAISGRPEIDCVFARYEAKRHRWFRNAGTRLIYKLLGWIYGKPRDIETSSYRAMKASLARTLVQYRLAYPQMGPMILSVTKRLANVTVRHQPRKVGKSGYTMGRLIGETVRSITNVSVAPLRFISLIGFTVALGSFLLAILFFIQFLTGAIRQPGFATIVLLISFFSGMILLGIGVLGEYIGRIIREISGPPRYTVRARVGSGADAAKEPG